MASHAQPHSNPPAPSQPLITPANQKSTVIDYGMGKIPAKRGHHVWLITLAFGVLFSVVYIVWLVLDAKSEEEESKKSNATCKVEGPKEASKLIFEEISLFLISMVAAIVIIYFTRLIQFVVEWKLFFETRYNNSWRRLAKSTLIISNWGDLAGLVFLVLCIIMLIVFFSSDIEDDVKNTINVVLGAVGLTQMFTTLMKLNDQTTSQLSEILESEQVNIATGMAWNYFTGYIELILTESGDHTNLKKMLHKVKINHLMSSDKLYLLLPKDCIVQRVLTLGDNNVKCVAKVMSRTCDRAGVEGRQYWSTIYEIAHTTSGVTRYYYGCFEYITPIDTFDQMRKRQIINDVHFDDQVKLFVSVFNDILEDHTSRSGPCVKLLTYDPKQLSSGISGLIVDALTAEAAEEGRPLLSFPTPQEFPVPDENQGDYKRIS